MIWEDKKDKVFRKVSKVREPDQTIADFGMQYMKDIKDCSYDTYKHFRQNDIYTLTPEQKEQHWKIKKCCICHEKFKFSDKIRHHHHEHTTGMYIGPAHPHCNTNCHDWNFTNSVFFHNLKGYDAHHILLGCGQPVVDPANKDVKNLTQKSLFDGTFTIISESSEKHKEITWKPDYTAVKKDGCDRPHISIKFKDSMALLGGSLAQSVESLKITEKSLNNPTRNGGIKDLLTYFRFCAAMLRACR
jgi:hypothetical protein